MSLPTTIPTTYTVADFPGIVDNVIDPGFALLDLALDATVPVVRSASAHQKNVVAPAAAPRWNALDARLARWRHARDRLDAIRDSSKGKSLKDWEKVLRHLREDIAKAEADKEEQNEGFGGEWFELRIFVVTHQLRRLKKLARKRDRAWDRYDEESDRADLGDLSDFYMMI